MRRFPRTWLKVFTKGWPTCDSLETVSTDEDDAHSTLDMLPVMAHRREDGIVKLNGPRNEQRRVWCLARHVLGWFRRKLLDFLYFPLEFLLGFLELGWFDFIGKYAIALFVLDAGGAFSGEGSVQFEEGLGVYMLGDLFQSGASPRTR